MWYNNLKSQYSSQYAAARNAVLNDAINSIENYIMQLNAYSGQSDVYYNQRLSELQNQRTASQMQQQLG